MLSLHEHNESGRVAQLKARLAAGEDVALISDAGTPLICDPGFLLVRELRAEGLSSGADSWRLCLRRRPSLRRGCPPTASSFRAFCRPRAAGAEDGWRRWWSERKP